MYMHASKFCFCRINSSGLLFFFNRIETLQPLSFYCYSLLKSQQQAICGVCFIPLRYPLSDITALSEKKILYRSSLIVQYSELQTIMLISSPCIFICSLSVINSMDEQKGVYNRNPKDTIFTTAERGKCLYLLCNTDVYSDVQFQTNES